MKAEIKKKLQFLIELGLNKNEINEILDKQEILNKSQEYKKEEVEEEEFQVQVRIEKEEGAQAPFFVAQSFDQAQIRIPEVPQE